MEVTIEINDDQMKIIKRAFGLERFTTEKDLANAVLPLAVEAWLNWLSGEKRYNSLTEQYTDWIEKIYQHLLPEAEAPSFRRLFNSFNIPYGQAQYIARVLYNKDMQWWRAQAREVLKTRLLTRKNEAYDAVAQDRFTMTLEVVLPKEAGIELDDIVDIVLSESPEMEDVRSTPRGSKLVEAKIPALTYVKVCELLGIEEER